MIPDAGGATAAGSPPLGIGPADPAPLLQVELAEVLNLAMEQNGVPLVREVVVRNPGAAPLRGATLELQASPDLAEPLRLVLPDVAAGGEHRLSPVDFPLAAGRLRTVVEAERGEVRVRLLQGEAVLDEVRAPLRVLAFNQWPGQAAPPGLLAAFVLPNHPVVCALLQTVRERLGAAGLPDALDGYQGGSRDRARALVVALYEAIRSLGLGYVGAPPSFETSGQKIRLPDAVLADRLGCCLDLSVLFAAALEQMGLAPLLVLVRGHAFVAAWLSDDRFPAGVVEDAARLRTQIQLGNVLPLETTEVTRAAPVPFEAAVQSAFARLRDDEAFECAVDVRALRTEYRPLPMRSVARAEADDAPASGAALAAGDAPDAAAARLLARAAAQAAAGDAAPEAAPPTPARADVELRFRRWKERLLDLTLRNRLLAFRGDVRGALQLTVPDLALLEDGIHAGRAFELLPLPYAGARDPRDARLAEKRTQAVADATRLDDLRRGIVHTRLDADALFARARHLDREARTALEEGGAAVLHLAIGFLRWYETPASPEPRLAPLLLYPVELAFDARGRRARLRRVAEDPVLNVTLVEKLRRDHGIDVSRLGALPLAEPSDEGDEGVAVGELLRRFREAIQHVARWEVLEEAHLGLFHFTRFLMWKDLEENARRFLENPVVRRIASDGPVALAQGAPVAPEAVDRLDPCDLPTVLDADATQLAAVASALDGQSFVLQGPPGTGKSQTIANLIAASLARQRTVLFVSEKMAALEVVQRRLQDVGLGDFCLELHSHKANKREVVASLRAALEHAPGAAAGDFRASGAALAAARAELDAYVEGLHRPGPLGPSVYEARARLTELGEAPDVPLPAETVAALDGARFARLKRTAEVLAAVAAGVEPVAEHPFRDARRADWSAASEEQLRAALAAVRGDARAWSAARADLAAALGAGPVTSARAEDLAAAAGALSTDTLPAQAAAADWPSTSARARRCVEARQVADGRRRTLAERWRVSILEVDAAPLARRFERWAGAFFLVAWVMLWTARRALAEHARGRLGRNADVLSDLATLAALQAGRAALEAETAWAAGMLGTPPGTPPARWGERLATLDRMHPPLRRLAAEGGACARAVELLRTLPAERRGALQATGEAAARAGAALRASEQRLAELLGAAPGALPGWDSAGHPGATLAVISRWEAGLRQLRGWCHYRAAAEALAAAGAGPLAEAHLEGRVPASALPAALEKAVLRQWHAAAVDADPVLRGFDGAEHARRVARFRALDRAHLEASRRHVLAELEKGLPPRSAASVETSEPSLLLREAQKKSRHLPIRRLLRELPGILPRLKPCFLMSPLSVAQYLPADGKPFDLVVFDEASQIGTHEAIGAIARGRQVVVVGDSRQMPPTRFFQRADAEDALPGEDEVVELESVLDEAVAKLVPQQWLGWHYRSRHESLIAFSNRHVYDGRLDVFPAAAFPSEDLGVAWHRVHGVYQGGEGERGRTNRLEAAALVQHLVQRLRRFAPGERTFGVVTFNVPQQQLVLDLLDEARLEPAVERHFGGPEGVFVKNLENVQGDERDEILFSVCYAPDAGNRFRMHYGPLSVAGGERRLNVAVTRARRKLAVFASIDPEQIDRSRTHARGAWLLREFLQHAREAGRGPRPAGGGQGAPSAQEAAMAAALRGAGWQVDAALGCSRYRLDLAVRDPHDPARWGVAVESDGPAYRSARSARDRDRLRAEVLEGMGWKVEREWSSSWWFDPGAPRALVDRVRAALEPERRAATPAAALPASGEATAAQAPYASAAAYASAAPPASTSGSSPASAFPPPAAFPAAFPAPAPAASPPAPPPASPSPAAGEAVPAYAATLLPRCATTEFYEAGSRERLVEQLVQVVREEGPIHAELLARRVAAAWGIERLTANPSRHIGEVLERLDASGQVRRRDAFYWPPSLDPARYRAYRCAAPGDDAGRDLSFVAPEELANAAAAVLAGAGSLDRAALAREVARLFGIQRLGPRARACVDRGIAALEVSGRCALRDDRVVLVA